MGKSARGPCRVLEGLGLDGLRISRRAPEVDPDNFPDPRGSAGGEQETRPTDVNVAESFSLLTALYSTVCRRAARELEFPLI